MASVNEGNEKFEEIKEQFVNFATSLTSSGCSNDDVKIDIKDLVWILQTVGFNISRIDSCDLNDVSLIRGDQKGIIVNVSCSHSGQRVMLEKQTEDNGCNCKQVNAARKSDDAVFWEVVATTPSKEGGVSSLVETGSDQIPPISKEQRSLIKNSLNFFVDMLHDKLPTKYKFPTIDRRTSISKPRHNSTIDCKNSPDRVRSLDILTKSDINQNTYSLSPSPILDVKAGQQRSISSPELSRQTNRPQQHLIPNIKLEPVDNNKQSVNKLIKNAYDLLGNALNVMSNTNSTNSNSSLSSFGYNTGIPFQRLQVKRTSSLRGRLSLNLTKPPLPKSTTPTASSSFTRKHSLLSGNADKNINKFGSAEKVNGRPERTLPIAKKPNKYANVKSTIPKPDQKKS